MSLFVLAHPDDEFGCFGLIETLVRGGCRPVCVFVTDGSYGGQPPEPRMRESLGVLGALGVKAEDVHFAGLAAGVADGSLHLHLEAALARTREAARSYPVPHHIVIPAWEGGHQDHDAAHILGLTLHREIGATGVCLQVPLYQGSGLPGPLFRVLSPLRDNGIPIDFPISWKDRLRYVALCLRYPSQWRSWIGLFPFVAGRLLLRGSYRLQPVDAARLAAAPHPGQLLYERRGACSQRDFRRAVAGHVQRLTGRA